MIGMLIDPDGDRIRDVSVILCAERAAGKRRPCLSPSEVREMQAQCRASEALCFYGREGLLVVSLRPFDEHLELFILLALAHRHGAVKRLEPTVQQLALELGAHTIAFEARRRGWARRLDSRWQRRGTMEFMRYV